MSTRFYYTILNNDRLRVRIDCKDDRDCFFRVNVHWKKNIEQALMTKMIDRYICIEEVILDYQIISFFIWLKRKIDKIDKKMIIKSIKNMLKIRHDVEISTRQLQRARAKLLTTIEKTMFNDYWKIFAYIEQLLATNFKKICDTIVVEY